MADISKLVVTIDISGTLTPVEYTLKDAEARQLIEDLGDVLSWLGVTTTALTDGATTSTIVINGDDVVVTGKTGLVAQYSGEEYVWDGSKWNALGAANYGALAFVDSADAVYQPGGTVTIDPNYSGTYQGTLNNATSMGSLPSWSVDSNDEEHLIFDAGSTPTMSSTASDIIVAVPDLVFGGTQASITAEPSA